MPKLLGEKEEEIELLLNNNFILSRFLHLYYLLITD